MGDGDSGYLLGYKRIAAYCGMSSRWVRHWAHPNRGADRLPVRRVGGIPGITEDELQRWMGSKARN